MFRALESKKSKIKSMHTMAMEFSNGGTKLQRFLPKESTQGKSLNFEN